MKSKKTKKSEREIALVVEGDEFMEIAHRTAVGRLPIANRMFQTRKPGDVLFVKKGFDTDCKSLEFMWVEVLCWMEGSIDGLLANSPRMIAAMKEGDLVSLDVSEVFDWTFVAANGTQVGGWTTKAALQRDRTLEVLGYKRFEDVPEDVMAAFQCQTIA